MQNDDIIRKVVQETINDFLKTLKQTTKKSARIEGEIPDVSEYIKAFNDINEEGFALDEGLIKTYPIDKTINYITRKYSLMDSQILVNPINNGITTINIICLILDKSTNKNTLGSIKHDLQVCGYFLNRTPTQIKNTDYFIIIFEPRFSQDVSEIIRQKYHYLYHYSPSIYTGKIIKNGLIPKSKNSIFLYPDRTFLMVGDKLSTQQLNSIKNIQNTRNTHINPNNPIENKEYNLIKIDVSKLPKGIKFYCDPMADGAIFTYDNIPPNAIANIEPFINKKTT